MSTAIRMYERHTIRKCSRIGNARRVNPRVHSHNGINVVLVLTIEQPGRTVQLSSRKSASCYRRR